MPIIVDHVSYVYQPGSPYEVKALDDVSLKIKSGEFVGLIGHTGSGKSTLIQHLNGLLHPTSGSVQVDDIVLAPKSKELIKVRQKVGLVFQYPEYQLFEETVALDIAFGPKAMGLAEGEIQKRVRWAMKMVDLDYNQFKDQSPFGLSGGEKRRVAIAGILAMQPKYLVLDEPTAGLDPRGREQIFEQIKRLNQKGLAVILVSHSMDDVARLVNRLIVINQGKIVFDDAARLVFSKAAELQELGLDIPSVMKLMIKLKEHGLSVPADVLTIEEAKEVIKQVKAHA
jgi:energy-coupling factor transport system ATP-binding protein